MYGIATRPYRIIRKVQRKQIYDTITAAKGLVEELTIGPVVKPVKRMKSRFDVITSDESIECPKNKLEIEFFYPLVNAALALMRERFYQLNEH